METTAKIIENMRAERDRLQARLSGLESDTAELNATVQKLQAELALKNKWIEGAKELEAIRVQLSQHMVYI